MIAYRMFLLGVALAAAPDAIAQDKDSNVYLLSYFKRPDSIYLAFSHDGNTFTPINKGQPVIESEHGFVRDPYLFRGQDGRFHIVATDAHFHRSTPNASHNLLFYARSDDLCTWDVQASIPVAAKDEEYVPADSVHWAPEVTWDPFRKQYLLHWSARSRSGEHPLASGEGIVGVYVDSLEDLYTPTPFNGGDPAAYLVKNRFLLFDPLNDARIEPPKVIDSNLIYADGRFVLFVKDLGTGHRVYVSERSNGKYEPIGPLIGGDTEEGGFAVYRPGADPMWRVYTDAFKDRNVIFYIYESTDLAAWTHISIEKTSFPKGAHHGSILMITGKELGQILEHWAQND